MLLLQFTRKSLPEFDLRSEIDVRLLCNYLNHVVSVAYLSRFGTNYPLVFFGLYRQTFVVKWSIYM